MKRFPLLVTILMASLASRAWAGQQCDGCKSTAPTQPTVTTTSNTVGTGCNKVQAVDKALAQIGDNYCTGAASPGCSGTCNNANLSCLATATATDVGPITYQKVPVSGRKTSNGQQATVPIGVFTCYCKCRLPLGSGGTLPDSRTIE
jgi:hypothetical protein